MSKTKVELCRLVLREHFGDIAEKIGTFLLRKSSCPLKHIVAETGIDIEQNLVSFDYNQKGFIIYQIQADAVLWRVRFPKYIYCAKTLYGDAAELLVEEMLVKGQSSMSELIENVTNKLNEALDSAGHPRIADNFVRDKFTSLVQTHFLQRCPDPLRNEEDRKSSGDDSEPAIKRKRTSSSTNEDIPGNCGIYWKLNFERFHRHFRDQALVSAITNKIDKKAGEVLRTMLRVSETKTDPLATVTSSVTVTEIFHALPKDMQLTRNLLEIYISMLNDDSALTKLATSHIESVVQERFGSKSLRIFKLLLMKKHLEQKQIEDCAMISSKEAKDLLYTMFAQNFVQMTEISKTPDHAPSRTFYLFRVEIDQVARMILQRCYKAQFNAMVRRDIELNENKRLLEKQERVDAIIASLTQNGADNAQLEEIEQTITPPEKEQIKKVKNMVQMLDQSEIQLDETIFILETIPKSLAKMFRVQD
ncbi:hypothetical protein KUTeg_010672, partial [Tegillarca granosa]